MKSQAFGFLILLLSTSVAVGQPTQSNATGAATTAEPAATTVSPGGSITGAALVPASGPAARTPDPGTRVGAGNTGPGLYTGNLTRTGDIATTKTAANPNGGAVIQNPGVRAGTLPNVKSDNTVSQTNLGANNTGKLNSESKPDGETNRPPVSHPGGSNR